MACGILRCALILLDPVNGAQQAGSWAVRETFVAVVIDNLPMIYPLCRQVVQNVEDGLANHYTRRSRLPAAGYSNGSYGMQEPKERKSKFVHPLSMRNATFSDSAEGFASPNKIKEGGNISVTREATVVVSPPRNSVEDIFQYSVASSTGTGYAVTCNA